MTHENTHVTSFNTHLIFTLKHNMKTRNLISFSSRFSHLRVYNNKKYIIKQKSKSKSSPTKERTRQHFLIRNRTCINIFLGLVFKWYWPNGWKMKNFALVGFFLFFSYMLLFKYLHAARLFNISFYI